MSNISTEPTNAETFREAVLGGLEHSVLEMLGSMAMAEVSCTGKKELENFSVSGPVTGLMVLVGEYRAIVAVCMPQRVLRGFVADIIGMDPSALTDRDLSDGIGEMVNMICGGMKTKLGDVDVELLPPMSIQGNAYRAEWITDQQTSVLEFRKDDAVFTVHTCTL